jgi:hypothetical protein
MLMQTQDYFYNCSKEYIKKIGNDLFDEIEKVLFALGKREKKEINNDILFALAKQGWSFDSAPSSNSNLKEHNNRSLCLTSTTLDA